MRDAFGNSIDPTVGYAFGRILADDAAFQAKVRHAQELVRRRAAGGGRFHVLTGNRADFPLRPEDLGTRSDGWIGPALWGPELERLARAHLGACDNAAVALVNRTSAGVVAACLALVPPGGLIASLVPRGRAHPCVRRGARLAGAELVEGSSLGALADQLRGRRPDLAIITPVTSELDAFAAGELERVAADCRERGVPTLADDAYGARVRPVLLGGPRSLELPLDLAITNADKAALAGPRAGILAGRADLVAAVHDRAVELGQEAREPVGAGVVRALERWAPGLLHSDAHDGQRLGEALAARLGPERVRQTLLGPTISEETVLGLLIERAGRRPEDVPLVPVEATAAVAMLLLEEHGIVTVNALAESGARPSLRLKPTLDAVPALGGSERLATIVDGAFDRVAGRLGDPAALARLIVGGDDMSGP